ncbi:MAG: rhomboid family intramembrane serine protease [Nocardioides sp.]
MTPASVGFQCPECIAEGRRTVRQPKRGYAARSAFRAMPVTWTLIGINVAIFLLVQVASDGVLYDLMLHARSFCTIPGATLVTDHATCSTHGGTFSPGVADGGYWLLLTSVFTHQQLLHLAFNMFSLWMIGPPLEQGLGKARYLATYLLCGLAGSALVYWAADPYTPTLGASGAIFGLLGALIVLFVRRGLPVQQLVIVAALNFYLTFRNAGISWQAHLGGFIGGLVIGAIMAFTADVRQKHLQWSGLAGAAVLLVIAIVVRSVQLG